MTEKLCQGKPILGFSDTETVMLDLDNVSFKTAKYWASRAMKFHKLEGFIILKSSQRCYHVVFNRPVSWSENMRIVAWVGLHSQNRGLIKWLLMQCIKQGSTLRISSKRGKPSPRIVCRFGKQDKEIRSFLQYRKRMKRIIRRVENNKKPYLLLKSRKKSYIPFFYGSIFPLIAHSSVFSSFSGSLFLGL